MDVDSEKEKTNQHTKFCCRLDKNMVLKVSDFGLSRNVVDKEYYKTEDRTLEMPVRWMSPESLTNWTFTTKSDVVRRILLLLLNGTVHSNHLLWGLTLPWIWPFLLFCSGHLVFCSGKFILLGIFHIWICQILLWSVIWDQGITWTNQQQWKIRECEEIIFLLRNALNIQLFFG